MNHSENHHESSDTHIPHAFYYSPYLTTPIKVAIMTRKSQEEIKSIIAKHDTIGGHIYGYPQFDADNLPTLGYCFLQAIVDTGDYDSDLAHEAFQFIGRVMTLGFKYARDLQKTACDQIHIIDQEKESLYIKEHFAEREKLFPDVHAFFYSPKQLLNGKYEENSIDAQAVIYELFNQGIHIFTDIPAADIDAITRMPN